MKKRTPLPNLFQLLFLTCILGWCATTAFTERDDTHEPPAAQGAQITAPQAERPSTEAGVYPNGFPEILLYKPVGTGRTTGHIITLSIQNPTKGAIHLPPTELYIPSEGKFQSYIGHFHGVTVPAGQTVHTPIEGECLTIRKPPLGDGQPGAPLQDWITPASTGPMPLPGASLPDGYQPADPSGEEYLVTYPGTDIPLGATIDFSEHPNAAAPLLFAISEQIDLTYQEMWDAGRIELPIPPSRAYQEGRQQVKWFVFSLVQGEPYTREELQQTLTTQLETRIQKPLATLPEETQEEFEAGVDDIWGMVTLVGAEAKVLAAPEGTPAGDVTKPPVTKTEPVDCRCTFCRFEDHFHLTDDAGNDYRDTFPAGARIHIRKPAFLATDCPQPDCQANQGGYYRIQLFEGCDKNLVAGSFPPVQEYTRPLNRAGRLELEFTPWCWCQRHECDVEPVHQTILIQEENDCCEAIRCRDERGRLRLPFEGGFVEIRENTVSIHSQDDRQSPTVFYFDYNVELLFCGLSAEANTSRIYGDTERQMLSSLGQDGTLHESAQGKSLTMTLSRENDGTPDAYTFSLTQSQVNGDQVQETGIWFSVDAEACVVDLAVLTDDNLYESAGPPISLARLQQMIAGLGSSQSTQYWNKIYFLLGQLAKMQQQNHPDLQAYWQMLRPHLGAATGALFNSVAQSQAQKLAASQLIDAWQNGNIQAVLNGFLNPAVFNMVFN